MTPITTQTERSLRAWANSLDERPGVYLIQCKENNATYVGAAEKSMSLRQRMGEVVSTLLHRRHSSPLLQKDWNLYGAENFGWWAQYCSSKAEALQTEKWLVKLAHAFEDHGGYCERTPTNCVSASLRETERKFAKAGTPGYEFLDERNIDSRIHPTLVQTFCQGIRPLVRTKITQLDLVEVERLRQLDEWKATAIHFDPESGG